MGGELIMIALDIGGVGSKPDYAALIRPKGCRCCAASQRVCALVVK
jgi:hypothetical protein